MGAIPYGTLSNQQVYAKVMDGYMLEPPRGCHPDLARVMRACLVTDPRFRPTFQGLLDGGLDTAQEIASTPAVPATGNNEHQRPVGDTAGDGRRLTQYEIPDTSPPSPPGYASYLPASAGTTAWDDTFMSANPLYHPARQSPAEPAANHAPGPASTAGGADVHSPEYTC